MEFYDQISCEYKPFVMFFNKPNFNSKVVNTDEWGFRLNHHDKNLKKQSIFFEEEEVSIVIGGSCVFGFGASSDEHTISSVLSKKTGGIYINFGATAFNSKQELLLFINFFQKYKKIKRVIIISGVNDIFLNSLSGEDVWGNFFFKEKYEKIHNLHKIRNRFDKRITNFFLKILKKKKNDYNNFDNKINSDKLRENYTESFDIWSKFSKNYNFDLYYFLQPVPTWFNKPLAKEEKDLFNILDNSNDSSHNILKKLSEENTYKKFKELLESILMKKRINFIDLNNEFRKIKNLNKWMFVDRVHLNDNGYEEISKTILDTIN